MGTLLRPPSQLADSSLHRRLHYLQKPQVDEAGTFHEDWSTLDPAKPTLVLIPTGGGNVRLSFATLVSEMTPAGAPLTSSQFADPLAPSTSWLLTSGFTAKHTAELSPGTRSRCVARLGGPRAQSSRLTPARDSQDSSEDLLAAIDKLNLGSYALLGESLSGANQAAWMAIKHRGRVWALCLISPTTFVTYESLFIWIVLILKLLGRPPELLKALLEEWLEDTCVNKEGRGDGTGSIPQHALHVASDFYFCTSDINTAIRKRMLDGYQTRCECKVPPLQVRVRSLCITET